MKRITKKVLSVILAVTMVFCSAPLSGFVQFSFLEINLSDLFDFSVDVEAIEKPTSYYDIEEDSKIGISVTTVRKPKYFKLVPKYNAIYTLTSDSASVNVGATLYDENMNILASSSRNGNDNDFIISYKLTAGETYYYAVYHTTADTGNFYNVSFELTYEFECEVNGHNYETLIYYPTCTEDGYTTYTCSVCSDSYVADNVSALGHTEGEWVVTKEAEVGVAGEETLYCAVCGEAIETREISAISAYLRAAEGSTTVIDKDRGIIYGLEEFIYDLEGFVEYEGGILKYIETANGFGTGTVVNFIVNGEIYESYTIIIFGDLTGDGVIDTYDAAKLAQIVNYDVEVEEGSAEALAADIAGNDGVADTYDLALICRVVNGDVTFSQLPGEAIGGQGVSNFSPEHIYYEIKTDADCENDGLKVKICSLCGERKEERIPAGHKSGKTVKENIVSSTATTNASYDVVAYCEVCGEELSRETVIVPSGEHVSGDAVEENRVEPDWYNEGSYDAVVYCTVCGEELSRESKVIPALGEPTADYSELDELVSEAEALDRSMFSDDSFADVDAVLNKITDDIKITHQDIVDGWAEELEIALGNLILDTTKAEAKITTNLNKVNVKTGDIVTVTVKLTTNFYVTNIQLPILFDKTQFEVVGTTTNKNYLTFGEMFTDRNYTFGGRADRLIVSQCSPVEKYAMAYITATYDAVLGWHNNYNTTYAKPQDDVFVTFQLKALKDVEDISDSVFVSTDWAKTVDNKGGLLTVGMKTAEEYDSNAPTIPWANTTYTSETVLHDHTYGSAVEENRVEPTCTEEGSYDEVVYCTECGEEFSRETITVPALGHTEGEAVMENIIAPTCTEDGSYDTVVYCSVCDEELSRETDEVPALGHTEGEAVIENYIAPTCTEIGYYDSVVYCAVCDDELGRETSEIDVVPHNCKWITDKEPTCTSVGYKYEKCRNCTFTRNENTVIEKLPHDTQKYAAVEPTCILAGNIEYYVCRDCGKCFSDSAFRNEISVFNAMIPAKGHNYIENVISATCIEQGYTVFTCSICGDSYTEDFIEAYGHNYESVVTPPTTTEQGYTTYTCTVCGDSYVDDFVEFVSGVAVGGTVTSFGDEADVVTITLTLKGETEPAYTITAQTGEKVVYSFDSVTAGEYTMTVSMSNHITRNYDILVGEKEAETDVKIHLKGDLNGDGKVNTVDVAKTNACAKGTSILSEYEFSCVDINGDGRVNTIEVARMNAHAKGVSLLW